MSRSDPILTAVGSCTTVQTLALNLPTPGTVARVGGAIGSLGPLVLAALHRANREQVFVALAPTPRDATLAETDLETLLGDPGASHLYPQKEALPYEESEPHLEIGGLRVEAVEALFSGRSQILVTTPRALQERVPVPERLTELRRTFRTGDSMTFAELPPFFEEQGFEKVALVEEVGQFAVRGGILDIFSVAAGGPVRIEFWGDEIESIRNFDILDQRSTGETGITHVLPVDFRRSEEATDRTVTRSLLELLPTDAIITRLGTWQISEDVERTWSRVSTLYDDLTRSGATPASPSSLFLKPEDFAHWLGRFGRLDLDESPEGAASISARAVPAINRDMTKLKDYLGEGCDAGHDTLLLCDNDGQLQRLEEILGGTESIPPGTRIGLGSLSTGFELTCGDVPLRVLNDHEIFRRERRVRRGRRFRGAVALESLSQLTPGDYVVHMDHGVGRFVGLEHLEIAGETIEALTIEYAGSELLRLPVYRLDLIERWVGEVDDSKPPSVHRIGGKQWKNLKKKTERVIEAMTVELLELYARREAASGFAFSKDTRWQMEMESSFFYEDTPDQRGASEAVKRDMESERPMDRLVCGDVGYGKTEVAIRAAFKAIQDGKQVAVLAPTTILVEQHRHTFQERLADYPVRIGALSRFRSAKDQKDILAKVATGEIDIIVGTHRLLSKDVVLKDLGLLIIDEEQRFGVKHKENLKKLRASIDVLTLSATPIPRTLYLSLSGIRDMSLIRTPPRDRMPIFTNVLFWSDQLLSEALHRELDRGGQTFFLHNRLDTIYTIAEDVRALVPEARIEVAHGQMRARELDEVMRAFVEGEVDVLVCSSIIENGLDVPNANTLIVDHADRFGLSQLYQIRGRVGRSHRRAYCYLLVPDGVAEDAERRLRILEHYTELGSGYSVALRDLELRGAGNLLGADQSGFAQHIGLDAYMRLVKKTVDRLQKGEQQPEWPDPDVSLAGPAYLPEGYVSDPGQKLHLYRRLSRAEGRTQVESLRLELVDRFGSLPAEVENLLDAAVLRIAGRSLGVDRILVRENSARVTFRKGFVPRMAVLEGPLRQRQTEIEIRRLEPLSIVLHQVGLEPILETLTVALEALRSAHSAAA